MGRVAGHDIHMVQQNYGDALQSRSYGAVAPTSRRVRVRSRTTRFQFLPGQGSSCRTRPLSSRFPADSSYRSARYSCIHVTARSEYCFSCSAGIFEEDVAETPANVTERKKAAHSQNHAPGTDVPVESLSAVNGQIASLLHFFALPTTPYLVKTNGFLTVSNRVTVSGFHAVFISGLPKLPCLFTLSLSFPLQCRFTIVHSYQVLSSTTRQARFWHPTCNRTSRRRCVGRLEFKAWRSVSAGRLSELC